MQDHHQLEIWRRAMDYAVAVYAFTARLPGDERYNLVSQIRRAATSVPLNIAEGCGCSSTSEFSRFLGYAYRSLKELDTCLELCARLHPSVSRGVVATLIDEANQISRMTHGFMQRLGAVGPESQLMTHD